MSPVTDDTELRLLRMAYRRAIGIEESLETDDKEFANDIAHELKAQMPEIDDFRGVVIQYYDYLKSKERYERAKLIPPAKRSFMGMLNDPELLSDLIFLPETSQRQSPFRKYYWDSISAIDEQIIYKEEDVEHMDIYGDYKEIRNGKYTGSGGDMHMPSLYTKGGTVEFVTPDAADLRRQVKDIQGDLVRIHSGWFGVGKKRDVPRDACYVGRHGDCYVWVCAAGREELAQFTLKILRFASLMKSEGVLTVPGPRFTPASSFPAL
jgi:hypothetical protein